MKNQKSKIKNFTQGFTIIETMISVSLFIVIILAGMTALLSANAAHQKSGDMRSIMDSLTFTMEDMARNIKTGYDYHCFSTSVGSFANSAVPNSCSNGPGIAFEAADGDDGTNNDQWAYYIDEDEGKIFKTTNNNSTAFQLTPENVDIDPDSSGFSVLGAEAPPGNSQQPFVTIRISGTILYKNTSTPFSLQTSVSQRFIDI